MAKSKSYQNSLIESLKDPTEAADYLNAALEDGGSEVFLLALRDVVDSYGGMGKLAVSTSLNRENLYRMLSTKGNPEFFSLSPVLDAVGFRLAVEPKTTVSSSAKRGVSILHPFSPIRPRRKPNYSFMFFWPIYIFGVLVLGSFLLRAVNWTRAVDAEIARMVAGENR